MPRERDGVAPEVGVVVGLAVREHERLAVAGQAPRETAEVVPERGAERHTAVAGLRDVGQGETRPADPFEPHRVLGGAFGFERIGTAARRHGRVNHDVRRAEVGRELAQLVRLAPQRPAGAVPVRAGRCYVQDVLSDGVTAERMDTPAPLARMAFVVDEQDAMATGHEPTYPRRGHDALAHSTLAEQDGCAFRVQPTQQRRWSRRGRNVGQQPRAELCQGVVCVGQFPGIAGAVESEFIVQRSHRAAAFRAR